MFKIGEFSRLSNISIRMLRHYEKFGLLVPNAVDRFTGFRQYSAEQLGEANRIQRLRALGFSLPDTAAVIRQGDAGQLFEMYRNKQKQLNDDLSRISAQAKLLEQAIDIFKEASDMKEYNVVLTELPARDVMSLRGRIPSYSREGDLWQALYKVAAQLGVKETQPCVCMSIFHDQEYKESDVDVEVQSAVEGMYPDTEQVRFFKTAPQQVASVTFHGSYDQAGAVAQAAARWMEANGYVMDGPMMNIMHVSPAQDPNPENWVTQACFRVARRA